MANLDPERFAAIVNDWVTIQAQAWPSGDSLGESQMSETDKNVPLEAAVRSPEEIHELSRRWIADARECCKDRAAIDEWKREMQDWGLSPSARDHRLAGAVRTASARRKVMDAMQRAKR